MEYKIVSVVVAHETTDSSTRRVNEAIEELQALVLTEITNGFSPLGGVAISATRLGHTTVIQTLTKGA